ncbi:MAG: DUF4340 domain-containing protein [Gammaproteobacteria bacterium]|nr:DUF4340 domain-containing protein [Gammaproteobacteria bacterium]MDH5776952.1 DUF4340 domain-containing protein [Gammaproteobacteria bacterium]
MNSRLILNIGLLAIIGILVLLVKFEPGKEPEPEKIRLTPLTEENVNHIFIQRKGLPDIELEKRNKVWFMLKPYPLLANDFRVSSVTRVAKMVSHIQYKLDKVDIKKFKLDKPEATIRFNKEYTVEVGSNEPIKRRRYVKSNNQLHIVNDNFYYQVMSKATTYAAYKLLSPEISLSKLELPGLQVEFKDNQWHVKPRPKDFSADSLTNLLNEWRNAQSLEIEKYEGPRLKDKITLRMQDSQQAISFAVKKDKPDVYLIRNDLKLQYKLTDDMYQKLITLVPLESDEATEDKDAADKKP